MKSQEIANSSGTKAEFGGLSVPGKMHYLGASDSWSRSLEIIRKKGAIRHVSVCDYQRPYENVLCINMRHATCLVSQDFLVKYRLSETMTL